MHNTSSKGANPLSIEAIRPLLKLQCARTWLSGGVGIDHWLGRRTRSHGDTDLSVLRSHWPDLARSLPPHLLPYSAVKGDLEPIDDVGKVPSFNNIWIQDGRTKVWVLQVNLEGGNASEWIYRRDPSITRDWASAIQLIRDVPTVVPAVQLLWKSSSPKSKDDADFDAVMPLLSKVEASWLLKSVQAAHPSSPWIARMTP